MRIQFASNLRLTPPFQPMLRPVAPILALQNACMRPEFLQYCSHNWPAVVIANHTGANFGNIHFLKDELVLFNRIRFLTESYAKKEYNDELETPSVVLADCAPGDRYFNKKIRGWIYSCGKSNAVYHQGDVSVAMNSSGLVGFERDASIDVSSNLG